ncbi:phosphoribosylglycinamide formyltransferase [Flavobacterium sp. NRK F10]|uniref:phosphoribosylglycinamide formyltransferase n=1 Tax=Flavobacterium sp. NRK F10 TaxID=2954931 RepID=UPI00209075F4|nr:phosphoribosylglycinamide formyltransferase [Flavobacterium sp. NRK F10]MCO6174602.1 phosphoribosylglycinamide formyltransferase [Flavobacterium sp. NRK F10]
MRRIVIFASGAGSNTEKIILHFKNSTFAKIFAVFSNKANAGVLEIARKNGIKSIVFDREEFENGGVTRQIEEIKPDLIVLAGFLWKFPADIIALYPDKIINIHPALLPKYGGKGMYGKYVHEAVLHNKEKETGITVHYVNEHYDEGEYIFQKVVNIEQCTSPEEIAQKVHELEHEHFPKIIEKLLQ